MTASVLQSHKCSLNEPNDLYIAFVFSVRSAPNTFELNVLMPNHDEIINSLYNNLKSRPRERKRTILKHKSHLLLHSYIVTFLEESFFVFW